MLDSLKYYDFSDINVKCKNWATQGYDVLEINYFTAVDLTVLGDSAYLVLMIDHASRKILNWVVYPISKPPKASDISDFYEETINQVEIFAPILIIHSDAGAIFQNKLIKDLLKNNRIINSYCVSESRTNQVCERTNRTIKDQFRQHFLGAQWREEESYMSYMTLKKKKVKGAHWDLDPLLKKVNNLTFEEIKDLIQELVQWYNNRPHSAFRNLVWQGRRRLVSPYVMYAALAYRRMRHNFYELDSDSSVMIFKQFNLKKILELFPKEKLTPLETVAVGSKPKVPTSLRDNKGVKKVQRKLKGFRRTVHIPDIVSLPEVQHLLDVKDTLENPSKLDTYIQDLKIYYDKVELFRVSQQQVIDGLDGLDEDGFTGINDLANKLLQSAETPYEKNLAEYLIMSSNRTMMVTKNQSQLVFALYELLNRMHDILLHQQIVEAQAEERKMKRKRGKGKLGQADTIKPEEFAWVMTELKPNNKSYRCLIANSRRRLVLFCLYCTGSRISDVCQLKVRNIQELFMPGAVGYTTTSVQKTKLSRINLVAHKDHQILFRSEFINDFETLIKYRAKDADGKFVKKDDGTFDLRERRPNDYMFLNLGLEGENDVEYDKESPFLEEQIKKVRRRTNNITRDLNGAEELSKKKRRYLCKSTPNSDKRLQRDKSSILERASRHFYREIRTHTFKATVITELFESGVPVHDVVKSGFHAPGSIDTTLSYHRQLKTTKELKKIMGTRFELKEIKAALKSSELEAKKKDSKFKKSNLKAKNKKTEE